MKSSSQRGVSLSMILVGVAAVGAVVAATLTSPSLLPAALPVAALPAIAETSSRPVSSATLLKEANLSPDILAASGLSVADVSSLATRAKDHLTRNATAIQQAIETHTQAKNEVQRLERLVRAGADEATAQALQGARILEEETRSAKNLAVAGLYTASTAGVAEPLLAVLQSVNAQRRSGLPLAFVTSARAEAEVVALRTALADQRIARREGREASAESQAVIDRATDDRVRTAQTNLQNLAAYRDAWRTALDEQN